MMSLIKLIHVLAIFIWVGNLLALTRLLGYLPKEDQNTQQRLSRIYRRMYLFVGLPGMLLTIGLGLFLFMHASFDWKTAAWFHMKLTFAFGLVFCDIICARYVFSFKSAKPKKSFKYKVLHGVTALILIGALSAIYLLRNKEKEIEQRILSRLETTNPTTYPKSVI